MPKIYIIGDEHENLEDKAFAEQAEKLAKEGAIHLMRENEIAGEETKEEVGQTFMEDKVIHEYNGIIMALCEIYPIIIIDPSWQKTPQLSKCRCKLDVFNDPITAIIALGQKQFEEICKDCIKSLQDYAESYIKFVDNVSVANPVSKILK
jgi:hypothetical protein